MTKQWKEMTVNDAHDFEKTPELVGILVAVEPEAGSHNSTLYTLELENGSKVAVWGSTVLDTRLKKVSIGQEIKIEYLGQVKNPKTGRTYKDFKVYLAE